MAKLGDICIIQSGGTPSRAEQSYWNNGTIPWVKISDIKGKYLNKTEEFITKEGLENSSAKIFQKGTILYTIFATLGEVSILEIAASTNQAIAGLSINNECVDVNYLYHFLVSLKSLVNSVGRGVAQNNINMKILKDFDVPLPSLEKQKKIATVLDKISRLIADQNKQLLKLDELVKSRFIELFGDPAWNPMELPVVPMTELCSIIDGDRGKNYPKQEEFSEDGHCLFLNAKNVTANGFCFDNCMFITEDKDSILRNGKLTRGDVVLTTRGTVGNLAFYDDTIPFDHVRINSGMVILRLKKDSICETFFIEQFKMQLQTIKERVLSGSAQPQLPISTMNQIKMLVPPLETQTKFAAFVEQADKLKSELKQSLEKLETLKKALMQQYFG